jgi:SAM-dependent methyltransferase
MLKTLLSRFFTSPKLTAPDSAPAVVTAHSTNGNGAAAAVADLLRQRFARYRTDRLHTLTPAAFRQAIDSRLGIDDAAAEGYSPKELERQRDLSIKFHWGHNHDFGEFRVEGRMLDRHIDLFANFIDLFPIVVDDFLDKDVFDIGCWTGGTALMLAALGSRVLAIEEVKKYAETTQFLADSFGIGDRVTVLARSLYSCNNPEFYDRFDVVNFPGVVYHLSDPLIGLRILFNSLRVGGVILVESAGIDHDEPFCRFDGSLIHLSGSREQLNRGGWNWYWPSPSALERMMREAGFDEVETCWHQPTGRVFGFGKKLAHVPICRAGLSVPDIR